MNFARSFNWIADQDAQVLILGSMPGLASLNAQRYYANPRNHFWPILLSLLNVTADMDYEQRLNCLRQHKIALWDVLAECQRSGSLDANIDKESIRCNDFAAFFAQHSSIQCIAFNGKTAEQLFRRHVHSSLATKWRTTQQISLPSTSPAHTSLTLADKLQRWRALNAYLAEQVTIVAALSTR